MAAPRLLIVQPSPTDPPARLADWLADAGLDVDLRDLAAGHALPAGFGEHAGVVVLGGPMGALDDGVAPFLPAVRALLRTAVAEEVPTLGVCLGHQLLAAANGGTIRRNPAGPEVGAQLVAKRSVASVDPLFGPLPITPDVIQWHVDEVAVLPPGATQLYSSPGCEQQAFRLGRLAWGIQFHIETTPEIVRNWGASDPGLVPDMDLVVERAVATLDDVAEVWQPFAQSFARVVANPTAVRAPRTVPSSSAAPITDPAAIRAALAAEAMAAQHPHGGVLPLPTAVPPRLPPGGSPQSSRSRTD